ncbi:MAG TPA: TldD/PmbA family protein [Syntrophomonadaceae bacterium]|nr:TldD/PmbA family protein [Syntrophomonadaceae bacterium]
MESLLKLVAEKVINISYDKGVDAEAFLLHDRELSIEVINGNVETLKQAEETGLGVRVINKGRLGFAYTSDLSDEAVTAVVNDAIKISAYTAPDENHRLPEGNNIYPEMDFIYDDSFNQVDIEEKINMARLAEETAIANDSRVSVIERAGYEDTEFGSLIMNTNGLYAYAKGNFGGIYTFLVAEENGDAQNGFSVMVKRNLKDLNPIIVGNEAAQNGIRSLNAKAISSAKLPCIMEPYIMTRFMSLIAQMVNAGAVQKGKSLFADKEGEMVAAPMFSLVDDGTWKDGIASFPFDSEGVEAKNNEVIKDGILQGFLYDTYTAHKSGVKSTGNAARGSFRSLPSVGTTNFMMIPGQESAEQLIGTIKKGFYITEVMGMHTANPVSGDFSVGAAGIMIENGILTYAVRGVTIAGNIIEFLQDIEAVGNDLRFYGGRAAPTVRLKQLSIGGE